MLLDPPHYSIWGAMSINAGDKNTIRNVTYDSIRVEAFELGQLLDIRVVWNKDYNPVSGNRIENITFRNVTYNGANTNPNRKLESAGSSFEQFCI